MFEEIGVINPRRRRTRKKRVTRMRRTQRNPIGALAAGNPRRRRRMNPQRRYRGSQYKIYKSTRRKPYTTVINPIEQDLVSALKTGAIMAAGMVGGMAIAAYAQSKSPTLAESKWAAPGLMIGSGVAVGMLLKGRNKPLATKLGMGAIGAGILVLARPYLAGKIPGFPTESFPSGTSGFAGYVAAGPLEGYTPALPQMSGFGEYDPFEYYEE